MSVKVGDVVRYTELNVFGVVTKVDRDRVYCKAWYVDSRLSRQYCGHGSVSISNVVVTQKEYPKSPYAKFMQEHKL